MATKSVSPPIATVAILGMPESGEEPKVLLQRRMNKKETGEFLGLWELPQGKIYAGEHLLTAARRELKAETGLDIVRWLCPQSSEAFETVGKFSSRVAAFQPYFCAQAEGSHAHLALAVLAHVRGTPSATGEASGHQWFGARDMIPLLAANQVMPLDVPLLIRWIVDALQNDSPAARRSGYAEMAAAGVRPRPGVSGRPTLCFDLGGVMIDHRHEGFINLLSHSFDVAPRTMRRLLLGSKIADRLNVGDVEPEDVRKHLCDAAGITVSPARFRMIWRQGVKIRHENVRVLKALRSKHPSLQYAVASNLDSMKHDFLIRHTEWYAQLDYRHVSCFVRDRKPNLSFYASLVAQLGCKPTDVFFVDDKRTNIEGAQRAGLTTFTASRTRPLGRFFVDRVSRWLHQRGD